MCPRLIDNWVVGWRPRFLVLDRRNCRSVVEAVAFVGSCCRLAIVASLKVSVAIVDRKV